MEDEATSKFRGSWAPNIKDPTYKSFIPKQTFPPPSEPLPPPPPPIYHPPQEDQVVPVVPSPKETIPAGPKILRKGNLKVNPNFSPLHRIAFDYNLPLLKHVLKKGDPNVMQYLSAGEDGHEYTPLHLVVECTDHEIGYQMAMALIQAGADPHKANGLGNTLLHSGSSHGNFQLVKYLVEQCNLNVNAINNAGNTPITIAADRGHLDQLKYYLEKGADPYLRGQVLSAKYPLTQAATWGRIEVVHYLLTNGYQVDIEVPHKRVTPLSVAAERGHLQVVELLLQHGANPNKPREDGYYPLFMAAMNGHLNVVIALKRAGADVSANNSTTGKHIRAIDIARAKKHYQIVAELSRNPFHHSPSLTYPQNLQYPSYFQYPQYPPQMKQNVPQPVQYQQTTQHGLMSRLRRVF